jgi:hypothetical protein
MKLKSILLAIVLAVSIPSIVLIQGCTTSQQTIAYNTLYSVEHGVVSAYDGYLDTVVAGTTSTNGLHRVSVAYNTFQASFKIALDAAQFNTNALAPLNLQVEAADVINLIVLLKGK